MQIKQLVTEILAVTICMTRYHFNQSISQGATAVKEGERERGMLRWTKGTLIYKSVFAGYASQELWKARQDEVHTPAGPGYYSTR